MKIPRLIKKDINPQVLWMLALGLFAVKLFLCSFQLMYASPDLSPIDDTLMVNLAKSIAEGNWLGEYNWLTLGKHAFFAFWLAFLSTFGINFLIGGQVLFALSCFALLCAIKPLFKTNLARLFVFTIVLFTPASWAEYTLRVYRDNIYPALVLLALCGILGAFVRIKEPPRAAIWYYVLTGFSLGAAWLCHEDNALLLPFIIVATLVYLLALFLGKGITRRGARLLQLCVPAALFALCIGGWSAANYAHYGRFIVSDFTASEFQNAMGALSRAYPEKQERYLLLPRETRLALYEASPTLATIAPYLETVEIYNGYGSVPDQEILSGGIHWAIRNAAGQAGYYETAQKAQQFYQDVANEVNSACDAGAFPAGPPASGVFAPYKSEYFIPTVKAFGAQLKMLLLFEQTAPTAQLSIARPDQSADWEDFMACESTKAAIAGTDKPYFAPLNRLAYFGLNTLTWIQRILLWPMLALTCVWVCGYVRRTFKARKSGLPADCMGTVLLFGFFLTGLLRVAAMSYFMAVIFGVGAYLMYASAACAPMLAFLAYCTAKFLEERFAINSEGTVTP